MITLEELERGGVPPAVKMAASAYLLAKAAAEVERERVDLIAAGLLGTVEYYADTDHGRPAERITSNSDAWLMSDDDFHDYLIELRYALTGAGYIIQGAKEPGAPFYSFECPALKAEEIQRIAENQLLKTAFIWLKMESEITLEGLSYRLKERNDFIDLTMRFVAGKSPFTGIALLAVGS